MGNETDVQIRQLSAVAPEWADLTPVREAIGRLKIQGEVLARWNTGIELWDVGLAWRARNVDLKPSDLLIRNCEVGFWVLMRECLHGKGKAARECGASGQGTGDESKRA
ncbi:hypothetical protein, partial [Glycomyces sp. YM15]|uniref:hypothetical protein n=1 Tax=Glycomyces sp. YM15 TaxID=2800446 RepID=UPI0019648385